MLGLHIFEVLRRWRSATKKFGGGPELKLRLIFHYSPCQSHGRILAGTDPKYYAYSKNSKLIASKVRITSYKLRGQEWSRDNGAKNVSKKAIACLSFIM